MKKAFTKRKSTHATLMYIPESESKVISLRIPLWLPLTAVLAVFVLLFLTCSVFYMLQSTNARYDNSKAEISRLTSLNSTQNEEIQKLQTDALQIQLQLEENIKTLDEIKKLIGVEKTTNTEEEAIVTEPEPDSSKAATDNISQIGQVQSSYAELSKAVLSQRKSIVRSMATVQGYKEYISSTPSMKPIDSAAVTASYGYRKNPFTNRGREFHKGVDFAGDTGTPVKATADGVVIFSGWQSGYGKVVILAHNHGITTLYGHNSALLVKKGDKIKKEQIISKVGSTGRSTGSHLHYEIRVNGKLVNPSNYY